MVRSVDALGEQVLEGTFGMKLDNTLSNAALVKEVMKCTFGLTFTPRTADAAYVSMHTRPVSASLFDYASHPVRRMYIAKLGLRVLPCVPAARA